VTAAGIENQMKGSHCMVWHETKFIQPHEETSQEGS